MTENQEKELFKTLAALVTGVNAIQIDVKVIKSDVEDIKGTVSEHSRTLNKHSQILNNHSQILNRLEAKTDSIAKTVITNDKRLTAVEKDVAELRDGVH